MAVKTKGLGGQLTRSGPARRSGIVAAMQQAPVGEMEQVALADIAANPANPTSRETDDLTSLVESIQEVGIVQALTLVPATDWVSRHPEHAEAVGDKRYVVLAGHRRRAAGLLAGQTHAPAMVRPELADTGVADVQLHENLHRLALTPLQEARAYQAKVDEGFSQRQIAAAVKVSQGQVAKRLSLLQLPEPIAVAVEQGWYTVADALGLLKLDEEVIDEVAQRVAVLSDPENMLAREAVEAEQDLSHTEALAARGRATADAWELRLSRITDEAERVVAARRREAEAQARAEELGAKYVADPANKFKGRAYEHEVVSARDIAKHAKNGNLAVAPSAYGNNGPRYYALAKDNKKTLSDAEQNRQDAERRKKKARADGHKARLQAIVTLVAKKPTAGQLREQLVLHMLEDPIYDAQSKKVARKIAIEAGVGPADTEDYYAWMRAAKAEDDPAQREQLAWVLVWAAREQQHQYDTSYCAWGQRDVRYFDDLIEMAGYEPGEWELEQLVAARAEMVIADHETQTEDEGFDQ